MADDCEILILYYSLTGHTAALADELRRGVTAYAAELLRWPLGSHLAEVSRSASQPRTAPAGRETARARSVAVLTSCSMRA